MSDLRDLPLTKFLAPAHDYAALAPELGVVDQFDLSNQHTHRRWEYAMALRALNTWGMLHSSQIPPEMLRGLDVGGAGSPLAQILMKAGLGGVEVVDPTLPDGQTVQEYTLQASPPVAVVTCVSVLEHVPEDYLWAFLSALGMAVKPGGLLFLTSDAREDDLDALRMDYPRDDRHFSWMRSRIFDPLSWAELTKRMSNYGFSLLGDADWAYRGPQVYDYTFASMALVKRV